MDCRRVRDDVPTTEVATSRNHIRWTNKQTQAATSSEWMKVDFRTRDVVVSQEIHPWTFHRVALSHVSVASKGSESILLGPQRPLVSGNGGRRLAAVSQQQRKKPPLTPINKLPASRCCKLADAFTHFSFSFFCGFKERLPDQLQNGAGEDGRGRFFFHSCNLEATQLQQQ